MSDASKTATSSRRTGSLLRSRWKGAVTSVWIPLERMDCCPRLTKDVFEADLGGGDVGA